MPVFRYQNRQDVYYELYGEDGAPVVSIVNGLSMRTSHWAPYFKLLPQAGVRVLSYDLLGQGQSSKPILGVSFEDHARILKALHDHLGIERPYVMGISFGGVVVLKYGLLFPDAISGLIPVSTFSELDPQLTAHAYNLYVGLARVGFGFYLDLLMPLNFTNDFLAKSADSLQVVRRLGVTSNELYGIQNLMESLRDFKSMTAELPRIAVPTLILNGEYDALTPRHLHDIIRRGIANSRLVIIPRMAHAFTLEVPVLVARLLAEFVHSVEDGSWRGDQSVWIANEDPAAAQSMRPYPPGDHLRYVPVPAEQAPAAKPAGPAKRAAARRKAVSRPPAKSGDTPPTKAVKRKARTRTAG